MKVPRSSNIVFAWEDYKQGHSLILVRRAKQGASVGEQNPIIDNLTSTIYRVLRGC
jgi:hypothetical protein